MAGGEVLQAGKQRRGVGPITGAADCNFKRPGPRRGETLDPLAGAPGADAALRPSTRVAATEVNRRWQAEMAQLFASDGSPDESWEFLDEVFHLETQLAAADGHPESAVEPT